MIVTIANQKGGVGKTTTAINLSSSLAALGKRTLLVDLDPQANSTMSYVADRHSLQATTFDWFMSKEVDPKNVVMASSQDPHLFIAPAHISLAKVEANLQGDLDAPYRLKDALAAVGPFDMIIVDTPPTLGLLTVNAMVASDQLIIPIQSSYFAMEGTDDLLETVDKIKKRANPHLDILGVLVTMFDKRTVLGRDILTQIQEVFGQKVFTTVIGRNVRLEESPAYKESIFQFAPNSSGAEQYMDLGKEVVERVG
jgi:chromosome partitioning protein